MIFPEYLKKGDSIGITACSCGVLKKIDKYEQSIKHFKDEGYKIIETNNVRTDGIVSSDANTRVKELHELYLNPDVKLINIASGGDYLSDILSLVDYGIIKNNIKWISGSSDPTSLLYIITTNLNIATIYSPCNMSGYDMEVLHPSLENYMKFIKGDIVKQYKYPKYELEDNDDIDGYNLTNDNKWELINCEEINDFGIMIGGCIECLKDIIGTCYDKTVEFIEKYKDEKIIWYFDVFAMSPEELHNTLLQFKRAGWFKYTDTILIGKVKYPSIRDDQLYIDNIKSAIKDKQIVFNYDIGHVKPSFTMINGAKAKVKINDEEGSLEFVF